MNRTVMATLAACLAAAVASAAPVKPPGLEDARKTFVETLAAKDWSGLANLVSWPLAVDNYGSPPALSKASYLKDRRKLTVLFGDGDKDLLHCVATAPLNYQSNRKEFAFQSWFADCNGNEFYFGQRGGKWLFTAYQNVNE